jgi:hypothetical protein
MFPTKSFLIALLFLGSFHISQAAQFFIPNGDVAALKAAINTSNTNNAPDTIHLAPFGVYWLSTPDNTFVHGNNGLPVFIKDGSDTNDLTILGNGATLIRDSSIANLRLLYILDCKVTIYNISLRNGQAEGGHPGGAILVNGASVSLYNSLLQGNTANQAGAVYCSASSNFSATECTFTNNMATLGSGSALVNFSAVVFLTRCVVVNNTCVNTSGPAALFNYTPLNSPSQANIYLQKTIVALNKYVNATSPDNGKEFDLFGGAYTTGGNFIGAYPVVTSGVNPNTFSQGLPSSGNDYVGTEVSPIDPLLNGLGKNAWFTNSYSLKAGSLALNNGAGTTQNTNQPRIASNGLVPQSAYTGDVFTIIGTNLKNINKVQFAGVAITTGFITTDTTITMNLPVGARTGKILIWNPLNNVTLSEQEFKLRPIVTPPVPLNVTVSSTSTAAISLQWQDGIEETGYQVEYKADGDLVYSIAGTTSANAISYALNNLACNKEYTLRVMAIGRGTPSAYSAEVKITTLSLSAPVVSVSSVPACTGNSIELTAPAGFSGYLWSNGKTTRTINETTSGDYSVKVTDNLTCVSHFSLPASITFYDYPDTATTIVNGIIAAEETGAQFQWYRDNALISGEVDNTISLNESGTYKANITKNGCTATSREIPFTMNGPISFTGTAMSSSSIKLDWSNVDNSTSYEVEYKGVNDNVYNIVSTEEAGAPSYILNDLLCDTDYKVRVKAIVNGDPTPYSKEIIVKTLIIPTPLVTSSTTPPCVGDFVTLEGPEGFTSYSWTTGETSRTIHATATGDYGVKVTDKSGCESSRSEMLSLIFYHYPDTAVNMSIDGMVVSQALGADHYKWYRNNAIISGETMNSIKLNETGIYKVEISSHGCTSFSRDIAFSITGLEVQAISVVEVFPIPASNTITVNFRDHFSKAQGFISLLDLNGKVFLTLAKAENKQNFEINTASIPSGMYILQLHLNNGNTYQRIISKQ